MTCRYIDVCDSHGVLSDKLATKDRVLTRSANFIPAELIDTNVKFEVLPQLFVTILT